jgi:hypothetical protein
VTVLVDTLERVGGVVFFQGPATGLNKPLVGESEAVVESWIKVRGLRSVTARLLSLCPTLLCTCSQAAEARPDLLHVEAFEEIDALLIGDRSSVSPAPPALIGNQ